MTTKKVRRGRPKKKERKTNPFLEDEENILLDRVKPKNEGTIMSLLNKRKMTKYELDEVFAEVDDEDL